MDNTTKKIQTRKVFEAFYGEPKTMLQVAKETNILRGNICRYVDHFRKHRQIIKVKDGKCPVSKHSSGFYSTHPKFLVDLDQEPELFDIPEKNRTGVYSQ